MDKSIIVEIMVVGARSGDHVCISRLDSGYDIRKSWRYDLSRASVHRLATVINRLKARGVWSVRPALLFETGYVAENVAWSSGLDAILADKSLI
jgi:hypothetical protein